VFDVDIYQSEAFTCNVAVARCQSHAAAKQEIGEDLHVLNQKQSHTSSFL